MWVRQRSQTIIIFLSSGIPKSQADGSTIHHHTGRVVVKAAANSTSVRRMFDESGSSFLFETGKKRDGHSRDILSRKGICRVGDEQACLGSGQKPPVSYHDSFNLAGTRSLSFDQTTAGYEPVGDIAGGGEKGISHGVWLLSNILCPPHRHPSPHTVDELKSASCSCSWTCSPSGSELPPSSC